MPRGINVKQKVYIVVMKKILVDGRKSKKLTPKQLRFVYEFCTRTLMGMQSASESARKEHTESFILLTKQNTHLMGAMIATVI